MVENPGDAPGTLRQAIFDASQTNELDDIVFDAGLSGTIQLNAGSLHINSDILLLGPGADEITIDAGGQSRVIEVTDGVSDDSLPVLVSGLTLTGGATDLDSRFGGSAGESLQPSL